MRPTITKGRPRRSSSLLGTLIAMALGSAGSAQAGPLDLPSDPTAYMTYGNLISYSLPRQAGIYDQTYGGGTGPGNPYYVPSTPGAIKDLVVIYTGASGTDVTTNAAGFEDAYLTPSGSSPTFASMSGAVNVVDPGSKGGIANPTGDTWDASLLALKTFLGGGTPVFLFNNNETNKDQSLGIWAKLWLTDADNNVYQGRYLYLSNEGATYGLGGTVGGDPADYNPGNVEPGINPATGATDYVMSGGIVCFDALWAPQLCDGTEAHKVNHNLGANQAAYAGVVPVLDGWLEGLFTLGDAALSQYTLHLDLRLGCAPGWNGNCDEIKIDNGYEQLFLASSEWSPPIPEPATPVLLGSSLLSLWLALALQRKLRPVRATLD